MPRVGFLLDENIPKAVADGLHRRGVRVVTCAGAGLLGRPDEDYLAMSARYNLVIVTQDSDFLGLKAADHAGIVYCEQGSRSVGQMISLLNIIQEVLEPEDLRGRVQFM